MVQNGGDIVWPFVRNPDVALHHTKEFSTDYSLQDFVFRHGSLRRRRFAGIAKGFQVTISAHVIAEMAFPLFDDRISLRLDQSGGLDGLLVLGLSCFVPFLVFDVFGQPALVSVPVTSVELIHGVGIGIETVDGIRSDLFLLASV